MRKLLAGPLVAMVLTFGAGCGTTVRWFSQEEAGAGGSAAQAVTAEGVATASPVLPAAAQEPAMLPTPVFAPAAVTAPTPTAVTAPTPVAVAPTPASRDVVLELSEADLESQLTSALVGQPLGSTPIGDATVESVDVTLQDRQVVVGGGARVGFLRAPFTAAGTVSPDSSGRPVVSVHEATVAGALLPESTRLALAETVQAQVDQMLARESMHVRSVEIDDGKMRLSGTAPS